MIPSSCDASTVRAVVLDADNTLWDTNRLFEAARDQLAQAVRSAFPEEALFGHGGGEHPNGRPVPVRRLGGALAVAPGGEGDEQAGLEGLARATAHYLAAPDTGNGAVEAAARRAAAGGLPGALRADGEAVVRQAVEAFREALSRVPPLLDGAGELLRAVRRWRAESPSTRAALLFSEGDPDRLSIAFDAYGIGDGRFFDDIVLRKKTDAAFREVRRQALACCAGSEETRLVMVGDSMKRDVRPANRAGFATIYCPGDYKGNEDPEGPDEVPDVAVQTVDAAIAAAGLGEG
jgi:putative hydrolase of the HAD superfamily